MTSALLRALHAETLKLKRTLALRMVFVAPALLTALAVLTQSARLSRAGAKAGPLWESHVQQSLAIWAIFVLPLLVTLEAALACGIEHADRHWRHLFALPVPRPALYAAKLLTVHGLTLSSTLVAGALVALSGWGLTLWYPAVAYAGPPPIASIAGRALLCWLAAGLITSTHVWIATRWASFTVAAGAGVAGTFFALFAASAKAARYYPWLLPVNAVASPDRLPVALALGIGGGLLVAVLGGIDFARREESAPPGLGRVATVVWGLFLAGLLAAAVWLQNA
jgi:lantibiotic transport system permease protein